MQDNFEDQDDEIKYSSQVPIPGQFVSEINLNLDLATETDVHSSGPTLLTNKQKKRDNIKKKKELDTERVRHSEILSEIRKSSNEFTHHKLMMLSFILRDMNNTEIMDLHMEILMIIKSMKQKLSLNLNFSGIVTFDYSSTHESTSFQSPSLTDSSSNTYHNFEHHFPIVREN